MITQDKIFHFGGSMISVIAFSLIFSLPISVLLTLIIGILKEIYDQVKYNGFSIGDLIADILGIGVGILFVLFM